MSIKKDLFKKAVKKRIPISGTFELTSRCNLSCEMCYIHMEKENGCAVKSELTTDQWISLGKQAVDKGMLYLLLTGGEPLLREDFAEIYTAMAEMGTILSVNTNGTRIDEKIVTCFKKNPPEKVNITLYGASAETYQKVCKNAAAYEKAFRGVQLLKEAGIEVNINTTFTKHNAADMESLVIFAKEQYIPIRMTSYLFPPLRCTHEIDQSCYLSPEEYGTLGARFDSITMEKNQKERREQVIDIVKSNQAKRKLPEKGIEIPCMAGRGAFWITWDGKLFPCGMLPELGCSLKEISFSKAWKNFEEVIPKKTLPRECSVCVKRLLCPVCVAVTQCEDQVPRELCRYVDSYITGMM